MAAIKATDIPGYTITVTEEEAYKLFDLLNTSTARINFGFSSLLGEWGRLLFDDPTPEVPF